MHFLLFSLRYETSRFSAGDRVCFVGNSITNNGEFHHHVLLYYLTKFPRQPVTFFNAGVSGDVVSGVIKRLDSDVLVNKPTHVVLMLGMNDVNRGLYGPTHTIDADTLRKRQQALTDYRRLMTQLVRTLVEKNITVILQKPSIYDQTARLTQANNLGVNDALKACGQYLDSLATRYHLTVVDYWSILNRLNAQLQSNDNSATIVSADRVHPGPTGHFVMAYQFLKMTGVAPPKVYLTVDFRQPKAQADEISQVTVTPGGITFLMTPPSLPFPTLSNQQEALRLVPFTEELNAERLRVINLPEGRYRIAMNQHPVGEFTHSELETGLILSTLPANPMLAQAVAVRTVLTKLWELEAHLRTIKFMEYHRIFQQVTNKSSRQTLQKQLDSVASATNASPFFRSQIDPYITHKPHEKTYRQESDRLRAKALQLAQPRQYAISITSIREK